MVEGAEAMVDPYADTVMAEDVMEELRAALFASVTDWMLART